MRVQAIERELYHVVRNGQNELSTNPVPSEFELLSAYPNPFNSSITIQYYLPERNNVFVGIYDLNGREVSVLRNGITEAGKHNTSWNALGNVSGVYFCKTKALGQTKAKQITLVK